MNAVFFINAYRLGATWMFDDKQRNIKGEPFVSGASELIQKYLDRKGITSTKDVPLIFSISLIPDADVTLIVTEKNYPSKIVGTETREFAGKTFNFPKYEEDKSQAPTSAWYIDQEGDECWLCPAQIKFFGAVADTIYAKIG
jgi:hypothetical protein